MELTIGNALQLGINAHRLGNISDAQKYYLAIIKAQPKHADANHNMGVLAASVGQFEVALSYFLIAIEANPTVAQYWYSYIDALIKLDRMDDVTQATKDLINHMTKDDYVNVDEWLENRGLSDRICTSDVYTKASELKECGEVKSAIDFLLSKSHHLLDNIDLLTLLAHCYILDDEIDLATKYLLIAKELDPTSVLVRCNEARLLLKKRKFNEALEVARHTVKIFPDDLESLAVLGACLRVNNSIDESLNVLNAVLGRRTDYAEAYINRGLIWLSRNNKKDALSDFAQAYQLKKHFSEIWDLFINLMLGFNQFERAISIIKEMAEIDPSNEKIQLSKGICHQKLGDYPAAIASYKQSVQINPEFLSGQVALASLYKQQGNYNEAIQAYEKITALEPSAEAFNNLGNLFFEEGILSKAIDAFERALSISPENAMILNNFGNALAGKGKFDQALESYDNALSIDPNHADAYNNIGNVYKFQGKLDEAARCFRSAISIRPDFAEAHVNLSFALLNAGIVLDGQDEYEWRWKIPKNVLRQRKFSLPLWDGKRSLSGLRVLVWAEQGVGDTINWSSCLTELTKKGAHCILECQEKLLPLLSESHQNIEIRAENREEDSIRDDIDVHIPLGSLYRHYISRVVDRKHTAAFLHPNPDRVNYWKERLRALGAGLYVGIGWKSSNMSPSRLPNYAPISEWSPLFELSGVVFVNLQYKDFEQDLDKIRTDYGVQVHNFQDLDLYDDLYDVAALASALDVVVSTTSAVPYISAGVGTITKFAAWKQGPWNNPLFTPAGPLIHKYERNTWDSWDETFTLIAEDLISLRDQKKHEF